MSGTKAKRCAIFSECFVCTPLSIQGITPSERRKARVLAHGIRLCHTAAILAWRHRFYRRDSNKGSWSARLHALLRETRKNPTQVGHEPTTLVNTAVTVVKHFCVGASDRDDNWKLHSRHCSGFHICPQPTLQPLSYGQTTRSPHSTPTSTHPTPTPLPPPTTSHTWSHNGSESGSSFRIKIETSCRSGANSINVYKCILQLYHNSNTTYQTLNAQTFPKRLHVSDDVRNADL